MVTEDTENLEHMVNELSADVPSIDDISAMAEQDRRDMIGELRKDLKKLENASSDNEYVKESLKQLISQGRLVLSIMEKEVESDPQARNVEVVAQLIGSLNVSLKQIMDIQADQKKLEYEKIKLEHDKEKNEIQWDKNKIQREKMEKSNQEKVEEAGGDTNILMVGGMKEVMKLIQGGEQADDVDVQVLDQPTD